MIPILCVLVMAGATPSGFVPAQTDFGKILAGQNVVTRVRVQNSSNQIWADLTLTGSCGCMAAELPGRQLAPGQQFDIPITLRTLAATDGPHTYRLTLTFREASGPPQSLQWSGTATIERRYTVQPTTVALSISGEAEETIRVSAPTGGMARVLSVRSTSEHVVTSIEGNGTMPTTVRLKVVAGLPVGHHRVDVVLKLDDATMPELTVPVTLSKRATGAVVATPSELDFHEDPATNLVLIRSLKGEAVEIDKVEGDSGVTATGSAGAGAIASLRVRVPGTGAGRAKVTVYLLRPAGIRLEVPVVWGDPTARPVESPPVRR
ncbi:MAG: DUF1573 domain-containing protein [Gemmataceae bacterium]